MSGDNHNQADPRTCILCEGEPKRFAYSAKEWLGIKACPVSHGRIFVPVPIRGEVSS